MQARLPHGAKVGDEKQQQLQTGVEKHILFVDTDLHRRREQRGVMLLQMLTQLRLVVYAHQHTGIRNGNALPAAIALPHRAPQAVRAAVRKNLRQYFAAQHNGMSAPPVIGWCDDISIARK